MKIFCSGIGGIGLSAYASLQKQKGHTVFGSDRSPSVVTDQLSQDDIPVFFEQDGSALPNDADLFVYSEAIAPDAPERKKATELGIRQLSYFQAVGEMSKDMYVIGVCGTHGKSSTTAMAAKLLVDCGVDPTVVVGTKVPDLDNKNWRMGQSEYFLVEACEYRRSFHYLKPNMILVTNTDGDHYDAYGSVDEYHGAFEQFFAMLPEDGKVIGHGSDLSSKAIAERSGRTFVDADNETMEMELSIPGQHMRENAMLALAMGNEFELSIEAMRQSLHGFHGTWRRMEVKGKGKNGELVVDDYAHHPLEVRSSLSAMKEAYPDKRIVCVFQPHMHDRLLRFEVDFLDAFVDADVVIVSDVYAARGHIEREADLPAFVSKLKERHRGTVVAGGDLGKTQDVVADTARDDDVVIFMGAGDITKLASARVV